MHPLVEAALSLLLAAAPIPAMPGPRPAAPKAAPPVKIATAPIPPDQLASLKEVKGTVLASACWEDRLGASCLVAWGRNNDLASGMECDSELRAARFQKAGSQYRAVWQIRDFSKDCAAVMLADSLIVVDIDGDGAAETGIFYEIVGDGADPYDLKFLLHYQDRKYAIRGKIPLDDAAGYEKKPDTSLRALPAPVRGYAESRWDAFVAPLLSGLEDEGKEGRMDASSAEVINPQAYYESVEPEAGAEWYATTEKMKPTLLWIRSEKGWRKAGYKHPLPPSASPDAMERKSREPDFSSYDVILLNLGLQGTTGDEAHIDRVEDLGSSLRTVSRHVVATGAQGEAMTWVRTLVRVPKLPKGKGMALTVNGKDRPFTLKIIE